MKGGYASTGAVAGVCLMEVMVSVGVLAMAVPLVMAVMAGCGEIDLAARAENRSCVMVSACMEELAAVRQGKGGLPAGLLDGRSFPVGGAVCALAFSETGRMIGLLDRTAYENGVGKLQGEGVGYIAAMRGERRMDAARLWDVRVVFEYPAVAGAGRRRMIAYQAKLP